ncbi:MAG: ABC transporter substrate-binding protein [Facklamia hominis]
MKKRLLKWQLLLAFLCLTLFLTSPVSAEELTIEDMAGRELVLEEGKVDKVVTLMPSDAEILFAIDAGDTIIARGDYVDYPADKVESIPSITTGQEMNVEEIIAKDPQLVIASKMSLSEDQLKQLEDLGIKVFITDAQTIEEVYHSIELLGQLVGHEDEASQLIEDMKTSFKEYQDKASQKNLDSNSVYYEISPIEFGLWTAGKNTFMDELGNLLGLDNIFKDQDGFVEVSEEQVLKLNPSYIVTSFMPMDEGAPSAVDEILGREAWADVAAVKDKKVFAADNSSFTRPGPRLVDAMKSLYEFVYEEK